MEDELSGGGGHREVPWGLLAGRHLAQSPQLLAILPTARASCPHSVPEK